MIRLVKMSGTWYAFEPYGVDALSQLERDADNIANFIDEGSPVILVDSRESIRDIIPTHEEVIFND